MPYSSPWSGSEDGPAGRRMVAEVPVYLSNGQRDHRQKPPQRKIDEFWRKFTTEAPGKATTVLPKNEYAERVARRKAAKESGSGTATQASFEEAAALCRAKVEKIIDECRRVNQKYRDPHFDLEFDLKTGRRDCLESLDNLNDDSSDSETESIVSPRHRSPSPPPSRHPRRRRQRHRQVIVNAHGPRADEADNGPDPDPYSPQRPHGRTPGSRFAPKSVKRVGEIFDDPKFYIDGPTANDVRQGRDGDCWFISALCALSSTPGLIERICVRHDEAVGVYGFVFFRDGEWFSEIIDDKLYLTKPDYDEAMSDRLNFERLLWDDGRERPDSEEIYRKTYQSNSGALYFAQCENPNETWLPLLEKAYAKAHGDYAAIEGGFTGEGIEDLTGGVTSELFTTDILDKESFWKNELMQVNKEFLFGCSTGLWGRGWGERKGIVEQHAYSVMRAVEMDGQRLLLLKNPWGKSEWKGPWSDGSKEWTPEWLQKLQHRFGDDGAFWISYKELLRKYQNFDRTRLFGPDWKIASIWTTLSVPWTIEYHDTKFAFTLAKPGPVVIVLSQLDDRYFRGLEGKYSFNLAFRLHESGKDDYLVRTQGSYRMKRSVNVELDLEAGEYLVLVKIDAERDDGCMAPEDVMRRNAKIRREKLLRIGLAHDLAHSKAKIVETPEEKEARAAYEKRKKDKYRERMRKGIMKDRERVHYFETKRLNEQKKKIQRRKDREKAKSEAREAAARKRAEEREKAQKEAAEKREAEQCAARKGEAPMAEGGPDDMGGKPDEQQPEKETILGIDPAVSESGEKAVLRSEDKSTEGEVPEPETSTDAGDNTPPASSEGSKREMKRSPAESAKDTSVPLEDDFKLESQSSFHSSLEEPADSSGPRLHEGRPSNNSNDEDTTPRPEHSGPAEERDAEEGKRNENRDGKGEHRPHRLHPEVEDKVRRIVGTLESWEPFKEELKAMLGQTDHHSDRGDIEEEWDKPRPFSRAGTEQSPPPSPTRMTQRPHRQQQRQQRQHHQQHHHHQPHQPPQFRQPPMGGPGQFIPQRRAPPMGMGGLPMPPPPPGYHSETESVRSDGLGSIASVSEVSERELDYRIEENMRHMDSIPNPPRPPPPMVGGRYPVDGEHVERDPWNAVAVVGLRVYYKVADEDKDAEIVKLRVVRPNPYELDHDDETKKEDLDGKGKQADADEGGEKDEAKVLDLDDSAKDATIIG